MPSNRSNHPEKTGFHQTDDCGRDTAPPDFAVNSKSLASRRPTCCPRDAICVFRTIWPNHEESHPITRSSPGSYHQPVIVGFESIPLADRSIAQPVLVIIPIRTVSCLVQDFQYRTIRRWSWRCGRRWSVCRNRCRRFCRERCGRIRRHRGRSRRRFGSGSIRR